jgi:hypothetical protein
MVDRPESTRRLHRPERALRQLQEEVKSAKAIAYMRKAGYDRLNLIGTGLFW